MTGIDYLHGTVKHYDWGGTSFIPTLLQVENPHKKPFAEYWLGNHSLADCSIGDGGAEQELLRDWINKDRERALGKPVYKKFGNLPYLLKVLDVKDMLSIQVHPGKEAAQIEYARENAEGIALDDPRRNYKDANHKPELMLALGEFWLLHGFKAEESLVQTLDSTVELQDLKSVYIQSGYAGLYRHVMEMPQADVNQMLAPLLDRLLPLYHEKQLEKWQEDFWAARAAISFSQDHRIDRGIFSIYLFNLLRLEKGEAIFQDAGVPHAYLEGQNVEIMANSDNVLRGGLTSKHIDVKELMKHVKCEATEYSILQGRKNGSELIYDTAAPDFELSSFRLERGEGSSFTSRTLEMLLVTEGELLAGTAGQELHLRQGRVAAIVAPGRQVKLVSDAGALAFRASVPVHRRE